MATEAGSTSGHAARPRLKLAADQRGWLAQIGPFYEIRLGPDGPWRRALQLQGRHLGGDHQISTSVLGGFAEYVLARAIEDEIAADHSAALLQLNLQHLGPARPERWLYGEALVLKQTRTVMFATAELFDDQQQLVLATATYKLSVRG